MKSLFVLWLSLTAFSDAFADCPGVKLAGEWIQALDSTRTSMQNANSHDESLWRFHPNQLVTEFNHYDSFGIYFQYQTFYTTTFNPETCILTARGTLALSNSYRNFEDPTVNYSSDESDVEILTYFKLSNTQAQTLTVSECRDSSCSSVRSVQIFSSSDQN